MHARDILSRPVVTVRPETPLSEAVTRLTEHGFAALPVIDDDDHVVGMLTESDALAAASTMRTAIVQAVMATPVDVIHPGTDLATIAQRMLSQRRRSLPVVEKGVLVGIVARRDVLGALVDDDTGIESKVRALLDDYAGSRRQWTIDIAAGRVTIRGALTDPDEHRIIAALARTVEGVDHVKVVDESMTPSSTPQVWHRTGHEA